MDYSCCLHDVVVQIILTIFSSDNLQIGSEWSQCYCEGSHSALVDIVWMQCSDTDVSAGGLKG